MALIHEKMVAILRDAGAVAKSEKNKDQGFFFRGVDAVTNAINPLLKEHGVVVVPTRIVSTDAERFENANKKIVTDVHTVIEYTWFAEDGSFVTTEAQGYGRDFADKAAAKASSVAFRTLLLQALALPTDDADPDSESPEVDTKPAVVVPSAEVAVLQGKVKQYLNDGGVADSTTGEVVALDGAQIQVVAERVGAAKGDKVKWKSDPKVLGAVVAAIEAGERK